MTNKTKIIGVVVVIVAIVFYMRWKRKTNEASASTENNMTQPISPPNVAPSAKRGRYLRLKCTSATGVINVSMMSASYKGAKYQPVNGEVKPLYQSQYDWKNLVDSDPTTFAHTAVGVSHILLDLGADQPIDRISVTNRNESYTGENAKYNTVISDRIIGIVLTLEDSSSNVVWQHTFQAGGTHWDFDIQ